MEVIDDIIDWTSDKVQYFTGEAERRELVANVKAKYIDFRNMIVENIITTNEFIVPFNQQIESLNNFRINKFGNHIEILSTFLGKFGKLKPIGRYTNENQHGLMQLPLKDFETKEKYINDVDWSEDDVFNDTFCLTPIGMRMKTRKMNLSLHERIGELRLETDAVKNLFETKRYAIQNNMQIAKIYLSCLNTISDAIDNIIIPELDIVEAFFQATKLKNEVISGNELINIQFPINMSILRDTDYQKHYMFVKNAFMFYIIAGKIYNTPYLTRLLDDSTTEEDVAYLQKQERALLGQKSEMNKYLIFEQEVAQNGK